VLHEVIDLFGLTFRLPVRTYVVTERAVIIDPALLATGAVYIVEIEARLGHPQAAAGAPGPISLPYATSTAWSATFRIP